jgi:hypothetical protein
MHEIHLTRLRNLREQMRHTEVTHGDTTSAVRAEYRWIRGATTIDTPERLGHDRSRSELARQRLETWWRIDEIREHRALIQHTERRLIEAHVRNRIEMNDVRNGIVRPRIDTPFTLRTIVSIRENEEIRGLVLK